VGLSRPRRRPRPRPPFALQIRGWTRDVTVFTHGAFELPADVRATLATAGVRVETAPIARLVATDGRLSAALLTTGVHIPLDALFTHPPQRQTDLVRSLGVALDDNRFVAVDPMRRETSIPGIYAAGDIVTRMQGAVLAAASAGQAAAMINVELTMELATTGAL
jgi:thioredoxin reductase